MAGFWSSLSDETLLAGRSLVDATTGLFAPTVRLGVTGLSRAGKTVFITALVDALTRGARLPVLGASAEGRLAGARLAEQPDPEVARFDVEGHLAALTGPERRWPESTKRISELRLVIDYQSAGFFGRTVGPGTLTVDIVDYPGEWLLDLALLGKGYEAWSAETIALSREATRAPLAAAWHAHLDAADPAAPADEMTAREAAERFTAYLRACRDERVSLSTLPPGRFLLPGDLEGSPALTFAPVPPGEAPRGSLRALMARRYDAYRDHVVRPFFRDHFARIDRQIVLVDALAALNAGPLAVADLERALGDILAAFRVGANSWWSALFSPRADRVLFAATKADHLHHRDHDRLEAILARLTERAAERAAFAGARVEVVALAAIRATREATIRHDGEALDAIVGTPLAGERVGGEVFDGEGEVALFPGDLPSDPERALREGRDAPSPEEAAIRFVRFRPPLAGEAQPGRARFPHIRLDRALEFLLGDRLA
jgi:predicted YcjX-like family ATPase